MTHAVNVSAWFAEGWRTYRRQPVALLGISALLGFMAAAFLLIERWPAGRLIEFVSTRTILLVLGAGQSFAFLRAVRGQRVAVAELFSAFAQFGRIWTAAILSYLIATGGILLLFIPGIVWGFKYHFAALIALDQERRPMEALILSGRMTQGHKWRLAGAAAVALLLLSPAFPGVMIFMKTPSSQLELSILLNPLVLWSMGWSMLVTPWIIAAEVAAYESLRLRIAEEPLTPTLGWMWLPVLLGTLITLFSIIGSTGEPPKTSKPQQTKSDQTSQMNQAP